MSNKHITIAHYSIYQTYWLLMLYNYAHCFSIVFLSKGRRLSLCVLGGSKFARFSHTSVLKFIRKYWHGTIYHMFEFIYLFLEFILNLSCSNSPHHILAMSQWYNGHRPQQRLRKKYLPLLKFLMNCFILPWVSFCHTIDGLCVSSHVTKRHAMNSHD
jgi:hypothetical protein